MKTVKDLLVDFLDYFFPNLCPSCNKDIVDSDSLCSNCWSKLNFVTSPICNICGRQLPFVVEKESTCLSCFKEQPVYDFARALFKFDKNSKKVIHDFKYYDKTRLGSLFARIMYNLYGHQIKDFDLIIPVPMHRFKRMLRFYNQSFILAQELAQISDKPVEPDVLCKTKWTKSQAMLSQKARKLNVIGSFAVVNSEKIQNKKIILVDDVSTTRSTVNHCAKVLLEHAAKVCVLCIAAT